MNKQHRSRLMEFQIRAFHEGTVEYINEQWVFFDNETEEASSLDDFVHQEVEIFRHNRWKKGILLENGKIKILNNIVLLNHQETIKIRKPLIYSLEQLLEEISDDAFYQFITHLNFLNFSIYDCIYCYNQLSFFSESERKEGVNFLIFDNQEDICNVQHHFYYDEKRNDRFEYTLSNGKRTILGKLI